MPVRGLIRKWHLNQPSNSPQERKRIHRSRMCLGMVHPHPNLENVALSRERHRMQGWTLPYQFRMPRNRRNLEGW